MQTLTTRIRARAIARRQREARRLFWLALATWLGLAALAALALPLAGVAGLALAMSARAIGGSL